MTELRIKGKFLEQTTENDWPAIIRLEDIYYVYTYHFRGSGCSDPSYRLWIGFKDDRWIVDYGVNEEGKRLLMRDYNMILKGMNDGDRKDAS